MSDWSRLDIPDADFDVAALHTAIDAQRRARDLSWQAVADQVSRAWERRDVLRPVSASTISGLRDKRFGVEGDGVLQMLIWLDRSPESFVPGHPGAERAEARRPIVDPPRLLRFDARAIHAAIAARAAGSGASWQVIASEMGASVAVVRGLARGGRVTFPQVVRMTGWLERPAADFTRAAPH